MPTELRSAKDWNEYFLDNENDTIIQLAHAIQRNAIEWATHQFATNAATEKLIKENEELKEDVEYLKDRPEFVRYMAIMNENQTLKKIIENESRDWAEDHTALQNLCRKVGCTEQEVNGDSNGVPTVVELAEMLMEKLTKDYDSKKSGTIYFANAL